MKLYSKTTGFFYRADMRGEYEAAGTWPDDAIEIDDNTETVLREAIEAGDIIDHDGETFIFSPPPPPPFEPIKAAYLETVRALRERIMGRLDGIAGRLFRAGDTTSPAAADAAIVALMGITTLPAVQAATDLETLKAVVTAEYKRIATAAPATIRSAFNAVDPGFSSWVLP